MNKLLILLIIGLIFTSCKEKNDVEYVDGKQRLSLNNQKINGDSISIRLINHGADSVVQGEKLILKITTSDEDYKIVNAMFDCTINNFSLVDTVTYKVNGCEKEFMVRNDTIYIAFRQNEVGHHQFAETVIAVSKGNDNIFRYHTRTFDYTVVGKEQN